MGNSISNLKIPITFSTDENQLKCNKSIIRSLVHIDKESISLKCEDQKYYLAFKYSARVRATIRVFLCAHHSEFSDIQPEIPLIALTAAEGVSQFFPSEISALSLSEYHESELICHSQRYTPLIIQVVPTNSAGQVHSSYLTFIKQNDGFALKLLRQQLKVGVEIYELVETYGNFQGEKCAVCLSDQRDTLVFPCKHLCLCSRCALNLKMQAVRKCPICRTRNLYTALESFLKISQ